MIPLLSTIKHYDEFGPQKIVHRIIRIVHQLFFDILLTTPPPLQKVMFVHGHPTQLVFLNGLLKGT